jgi:hypothetical protein
MRSPLPASGYPYHRLYSISGSVRLPGVSNLFLLILDPLLLVPVDLFLQRVALGNH